MRTPFEHPILFIGGKGGVGKTTTAASLAVATADRGQRCLLVSTDPAHSLSDLFATPIGDRERRLEPGLWGLEIDPDEEAERYIATVKSHMRRLVHPEMYPVVNRQLDFARHAPGSSEAALMERVADLMAEAPRRFDRLIFDTAPTGHTMRLLALPEVMAVWTEGLLKRHDKSKHLGKLLMKLGGRGGEASGAEAEAAESSDERRNERIHAILTARRNKFVRARELLLDRECTTFVLVLTPEKLPILESRKASELLEKHDIAVGAVVVNRVLPDEAGGDFLAIRRRQELQHLREIDRIFRGVSRFTIPFLPDDVHGFDTLRRIGRALTGGEPT